MLSVLYFHFEKVTRASMLYHKVYAMSANQLRKSLLAISSLQLWLLLLMFVVFSLVFLNIYYLRIGKYCYTKILDL